ncbi:murein hydrolase activator EnvC family protein [Sphingomonas nostoxanthinifaciens]|uniref:murein hydrolase activator EnvC family protein n=1 Tax=Sphingomonas nostoxanthinifaciens TaxID=2872652 RepID=UPI001CC1DF4D|nr:peptidoglycan DD-metalloendopeptidase family protein [Sphingomonas nostoxanthinifaciens]UAK24558.1 peptidoglycan DD-metalloendopeptidase family protein [Sphingomonas nostoxanthinifaciens]
MLLAFLAAAADPAALAPRLAATDRALADARTSLAATRAPLTHILAVGSEGDPFRAGALYRALAPGVAQRSASIERQIATLTAQRAMLADALDAANAAEASRAGARDAAVTVRLARLPLPPAPLYPASPLPLRPVYTLPANGSVVSGTGERLETGVLARGLTLATIARAQVVAPALGRVAYARRFRGYGGVVILDHGHGWTTLLAGLDRVEPSVGTWVPAGASVGTMAAVAPRLTIELRHHGRPIDVAAMTEMGTARTRS